MLSEATSCHRDHPVERARALRDEYARAAALYAYRVAA
jgi:hypothetical protein